VLFNIGQTEYQLRDYASALRTFERYLAEAGPSASNRAEVENAVKVLRSRVGRLMVTTDPPGADISVDDAPVGKTPFAKPVLVGVGRVKIIASITGRSPVTRYVDVAADDDVPVAIELTTLPSAPAPTDVAAPQVELRSKPAAATTAPGWHTVGWIAAGVAGGGAIAFGLLARKESDDLKAARATYPTTTATLDHLSSRTTTYSVVADSLAAVAVVAAGVTLFSTLTGPSGDTTSPSGTRVSLGLGSLRFETRF
jgi:hypothetical protein